MAEEELTHKNWLQNLKSWVLYRTCQGDLGWNYQGLAALHFEFKITSRFDVSLAFAREGFRLFDSKPSIWGNQFTTSFGIHF